MTPMTSAATPAPFPSRSASKPARQARIVTILSREQVHSQEQLAGLLSQYANLHVTQATLSRDLDELGVVRLRAADGALVYALPGDPGGPGSPAGASLGHPERSRLPQSPLPASPGTAAQLAPVPPEAAAIPASAGPASPAPASSDGQFLGSQAPDPRDASGDANGQLASGPGTSEPGPSGQGAGSTRLVRYLKELLTSAEASANLVVLRTPAGAAQFLASAIDHADWPAILGTVAGDDTVLVIAADPLGGEALAEDFRRLSERRR
jgi:arginine repressor